MTIHQPLSMSRQRALWRMKVTAKSLTLATYELPLSMTRKFAADAIEELFSIFNMVSRVMVEYSLSEAFLNRSYTVTSHVNDADSSGTSTQHRSP